MAGLNSSASGGAPETIKCQQAAARLPSDDVRSVAFRVFFRDALGEACDLVAAVSPEAVRIVLMDKFPLVVDEKTGGAVDALWSVALDHGNVGALVVRASQVSLKSMQELRDQVLAGDFDAVLSQSLLGDERAHILQADRTEFAERYEEGMLSLERLTPHQQEKAEECARLGSDGIHIKAPAGAGKTFVALQRVLQLLSDEQDVNYVLFVAQNAALACFAASWLAKRVRDPVLRRMVLSRFHLLREPFEDGPQAVEVKRRRIRLSSASDGTTQSYTYRLVVVDEAHHVYSRPDACSVIESLYVTASHTQRLLLSDVSQSLGRGVRYPEMLTDVILSEVVRCSKRIVAGAMAFQLGGHEKLLTKCHHDATGPPLSSFLFDLPSGIDATHERYFEAYAEHTLRALQHVVAAFPGLNFHNRIALVVPDDAFLERLRPALMAGLRKRLPGRRLRLVPAMLGSSDLRRVVLEDVENAEPMEEGDESDEDEAVEWLVYDSVANIDGLERLIVVAIGLDSVITEDEAHTGDARDVETRSMLYRAITRSHLMFLVVNEFLRGGWLEFLGSVRLRDSEAFDSATELARAETRAVEGVVLAELSKVPPCPTSRQA